MARQTTIQNYNNLTGGIVTDGDPIVPAENAAKDALNFWFMPGGAFYRKGLDYEAGASSPTVSSVISGVEPLLGDGYAEFDSTSGYPGADIALRQTGDYVVQVLDKGVTNVLADNSVKSSAIISSPLGRFNQSATYTDSNGYYPSLRFVKAADQVFAFSRKIAPVGIQFDGSSYSYNLAAQSSSGYDYVDDTNNTTNMRVRDLDGIYDGYRSDGQDGPVYCNHMVVTSVSGTFTVGEEVTDSDNGRSFRVVAWDAGNSVIHLDKWPDSDTATGSVAFDAADGTDYTSSVLTGTDSSATATVSSSADGISDAYYYNLSNQGWSYDNFFAYLMSSSSVYTFSGIDYYTAPKHNQVWFSGKDSSGSFDPAALVKIDFGSTPAPRGRMRLDPFKMNRNQIAAGNVRLWGNNTVFDPLTPDYGFDTATSFANRVAWSGADNKGTSGTIYISPTVDRPVDQSVTLASDYYEKFFQFAQKNDPTAEIGNELLADDGLTIHIAEAGNILKLVSVGSGFLAFSKKGVWAITGGDYRSAFRADDFAVTKISGAPGTDCPDSVVDIDGVIMYWTRSHIWVIEPANVTGGYEAKNVSANRIEGLLKDIPTEAKPYVKGHFDQYNQRVLWAYTSTTSRSSLRFRDSILDLDLVTNGFTKLKIAGTYTGPVGWDDAELHIRGFASDLNFSDSDGKIPLKLFMGDSSDTNSTMLYPIMEFNSSEFVDYTNYVADQHSLTTDAEYSGYIEGWSDPLGDWTRKKQSVLCMVYMNKTEYGFEDIGGGVLSPLGQSKLSLQGRWDWHDSSAGNRFTTAREAYRHRRTYIPADTSDTYDTGESVIITKNKLRGRGYALAVYFAATPGYDAQLVGYSIPYTVDATP